MGVLLSVVLGVLDVMRRADGKPLRRTVTPDGVELYSLEYCRRWNATHPFEQEELSVLWCAILNLPRLLRCRGVRRRRDDCARTPTQNMACAGKIPLACPGSKGLPADDSRKHDCTPHKEARTAEHGSFPRFTSGLM